MDRTSVGRTVRARAPWVVAAVVSAGLAGAACGDSDVEEGCTSGPCTGATSTSTGDGTTTSSTSGAGGGGGGEPAACAFEDTGDLPCDVFTILDAKCHRCHTDPTANGAPFPLLTWDHFQADYFGKPVWERASAAIQPDAFPRMPFGEDPLPAETRAVLDAWFDTCRAGACARAEGSDGAGGGTTSSGEGGAGGTGAGGSGGAGGG